MSRAGAAIGVWLLAVGSVLGADWRDHLPADWLVVAETPDLARLDDLALELLEPWGRRAPPLRAALTALAPPEAFTERAWAFAVASGAEGELTGALYAPTDDFETLCAAFDADRADDLAIASLFGFDIAIEPVGGWARFTLLDSPPRFTEPAAPPRLVAGEEVAMSVTLSAAGCRRLAEHLEAKRAAQAADRRRRYGPRRWPNDFKTAVDRLAPFAPVAAAVATWDEPVTLIASRRRDDLVIEISSPIATETTHPQALPQSLKRKNEILWLDAPGDFPAPLVDLALALMASRPDQIEAPEHPQPQWDDFADACRELLAGCRSCQAVLTLPTGDEPAAANESAAFTWDESAGSLGDRLRMCVDRWNTMVDAARARTPLKFEMAPQESTGGFRLRTDLIAGTGLEPSPEIEAIFNRYYGAGRWAVTELTPLSEGAWVATMRQGVSPLADGVPTTHDPGTLLRAELRLDRLTAWQRLLEDLQQEGAIGYRPRAPMREATPLGFRVTGGDRLRLTTTAPLDTYRSLVDHYRSEPLPIDDD